MTIYRKEPIGAEKFAQASYSSPRQISDLVLKAPIRLGELDASLGEWMSKILEK